MAKTSHIELKQPLINDNDVYLFSICVFDGNKTFKMKKVRIERTVSEKAYNELRNKIIHKAKVKFGNNVNVFFNTITK